jgi:hypothetical protein
MNDVPKCWGDGCPIRDRCERFTVPAGDYQWYAGFENSEHGRTEECEGFEEVSDEK